MYAQQSALEAAITQALAELDAECERWGVRLLLIGGFAVRAYSERKRETTDIDFVTSRVDRNTLASVFKRLGYQFEAESRFGMKATRQVGGQMLHMDIVVEEIHDLTTDSVYILPPESFSEASRQVVESLSGESRVEFYVIPLADLLISKLMTARQQDANDAINLILGSMPSEKLQIDFVRKARQSKLETRINARLAELLRMSDRQIQTFMTGYTAGRLTIPELNRLRASLRSLKI